MPQHPLFRDDPVEAFYAAVSAASRRKAAEALLSLHIPVSTVFYVRAAIEADTGIRYSLSHIEEALYLEGMLAAEDCFKQAELYA